jgi:hypothetical protein
MDIFAEGLGVSAAAALNAMTATRAAAITICFNVFIFFLLLIEWSKDMFLYQRPANFSIGLWSNTGAQGRE